MTDVRLQNCFDLLSTQYEDFSRIILANQSINIYSKSVANTNLFVESFFTNYFIRKKYLKNNFDKYIFLNIQDGFSDATSLDLIILNSAEKILDVRFESIKNLARFLEEYNYNLIILNTSANTNELRLLMSLSFFFKEKLLFIFSSSEAIDFVEKSFILEFSDAFINSYAAEALSAIGVEGVKEKLDITLANGDISQIGQALEFSFLNKPLSKISEKREETHGETASAEAFSNEAEIIIPQNKTEKKISEAKPDTSGSNSSEINLTPRENAVLEKLQERKILSREEIANLVWGNNEVKADAMDQFISRFRRKFVKAGFDKDYIQVKKGVGILIK